jgi:hypothetical protein
MRFGLILFLLAISAAAIAQTPCQGGTAVAPACARDWSIGPLRVLACPGDNVTTTPGARLIMREVNGTPILSVVAATPGGQIDLPSASAPRAPLGALTRTVQLHCEDAAARGGPPTFASVTFPAATPGPPVAPLLP